MKGMEEGQWGPSQSKDVPQVSGGADGGWLARRAHSLKFQAPLRVNNTLGDLVRSSPLALVAVQGGPPLYQVLRPAPCFARVWETGLRVCLRGSK